MPSLFRSSCAALLLAVFSSSCVLAIGTGDKGRRLALGAAASEKGESGTEAAEAAPAGDAQGAKVAASAEAKAKKAARKAEKKAREISYAQMELALAEMDAERELIDATHEFEHARHGQEAAQRELEHFQKMERPLELEDQQMDVERSVESALEQKQELEELRNMYKADDFAKMTKELVLQRGEFRMKMAQREAELDKKRAADKQQHELAVKERDLTLALKKAQDGVADAEAKLKKTKAHNELELLRARHKIEDAQRPDEDEEADGKEAGESKGA